MDSSKFLHMEVRKEAGVVDPEYGDTECSNKSNQSNFFYLLSSCVLTSVAI